MLMPAKLAGFLDRGRLRLEKTDGISQRHTRAQAASETFASEAFQDFALRANYVKYASAYDGSSVRKPTGLDLIGFS